MKAAQNRCRVMESVDSGGLRMRLRHATERLHRRVEEHLDLLGRSWTPAAYCHVLETLLAIYAPIERGLTALDWSDSGIDVATRCKSHWLEADLAHFGVDAKSLQMTCPDLPQLETVASGLGALYVLEGATLGGQMILRRMQPQLAISSTNGGRFYASYGTHIGAMWRSYISALENAAQSPQLASEIEFGALETFGAVERWFSSQLAVHAREPANV
jgi:heme oxygenase